ncbi:hypothetical protein HELRODRAFT_165818 [Helobdella robusta]|uniref:Uncharacterized protein n=1 Tax=Helobdella robusta TaxID=6412 RepID=T1EXB6_HELRO|nr:hypothetical protein HELRODRAFT_165818 [Helobdella robusta]ESN91749.1 hypothetical protein HELRODRAFT_165818 [Helobdella robusta]
MIPREYKCKSNVNLQIILSQTQQIDAELDGTNKMLAISNGSNASNMPGEVKRCNSVIFNVERTVGSFILEGLSMHGKLGNADHDVTGHERRNPQQTFLAAVKSELSCKNVYTLN